VIWGLSTPVLWNTGRRNHEFALQLPLVALGGAAFYAFAAQGIRTAAVIAALLLVSRSLVIGIAAFRALNLRPTSLLPHVLRGLFLGAVCAVGVMAGQRLTAGLDVPLVSLLASGLTAVAIAGSLVALRPQLLGEQTADMVLRFAPSLSSWLEKTRSAPLPEAPGDPHARGELHV
jgi:lipopolysaccharide exporter